MMWRQSAFAGGFCNCESMDCTAVFQIYILVKRKYAKYNNVKVCFHIMYTYALAVINAYLSFNSLKCVQYIFNIMRLYALAVINMYLCFDSNKCVDPFSTSCVQNVVTKCVPTLCKGVYARVRLCRDTADIMVYGCTRRTSEIKWRCK
jgi:hypothetical protein